MEVQFTAQIRTGRICAENASLAVRLDFPTIRKALEALELETIKLAHLQDHHSSPK